MVIPKEERNQLAGYLLVLPTGVSELFGQQSLLDSDSIEENGDLKRHGQEAAGTEAYIKTIEQAMITPR